MRFFIAGIMQGSLTGADLQPQDYRKQVRRLLECAFADAEVYDPQANHNNSLDYDEKTGRETFLGHNRMCRDVDVVIAYAPQASMGTAIEMWEAFRNGKVVITISPMKHNWVVKFCSHLVVESLQHFEDALSDSTIQQLLDSHTNTIDPPFH